MNTDSYYMEKAIGLGRLGMNLTSPNPKVGCVLVKDGRIIGTGYHKKFGCDHAEVEAINSATENVKGCTVYVTLEPCSHHGKTPPCVNRLVEERVKRVVVGLKDPNPQVKGIEFLRKNGIEVNVGVLKDEARELIKDYFKFMVKKKPYITVKAALSWDGKIATRTGKSQWISNNDSRNFAMTLRGENDAVLVGVNTVNCDNPMLTYRLIEPAARQPLRIVVDADLSINLDSEILKKNTVIITSPAADDKKKEEIKKKGTEVVQISGNNSLISPGKIIEYLYKRNIMSLLIEGGGTTIGNFFMDGSVDRVIFIYGSIIIGGKDAPTACDGLGIDSLSNSIKLSNIKRFELGKDLVMQADVIL